MVLQKHVDYCFSRGVLGILHPLRNSERKDGEGKRVEILKSTNIYGILVQKDTSLVVHI